MNNEERIAAMRKDSGSIKINSRLVGFLYDLMRDHLPPGIVEKLVQESEGESNIVYTNGWLAQYAEYLANRLQEQVQDGD